MALAASLAATQAVINAIPDGGLANGDPYVNNAMPSNSHIRKWLKWPLADDGTQVSIAHHVVAYAKVDLAEDAMPPAAERADIETAAILAIGRLAAARYYGWNHANLSVAESYRLPAGVEEPTIHTDHEVAVAEALQKWSGPASRYMALFYYNSISYETSGHHHLPQKTKKLAKTTILLTGLAEWMSGDAEREGSVFHDMFHPLSDTEKSNAARKVSARDHLSNLKFDNLRKRIPVKAPDSGIAINYPVLLSKAISYRHNPDHIPVGLAAPESVTDAITAYEEAADANQLQAAVNELRRLSEILAEPSAYLAGFILGREAAAVEDADLDLKTAARTTTILGSPAYARAAGEYSGTFVAGKENGFKVVPDDVPDEVIPRILAKVAMAAGHPEAAEAELVEE